jgi:hypothetical protein
MPFNKELFSSANFGLILLCFLFLIYVVIVINRIDTGFSGLPQGYWFDPLRGNIVTWKGRSRH